MRRSALVTLLALVAGAAALAVLPRPAQAALAGSIGEDTAPAPALAERLPFSVYLPPGYAGSTGRYPVIYFLHGLPASPVAYRDVAFLARALEQAGKRAILVAPRGARPGDTDPEYLDRGPGRGWETAIARQLPAYVDAHYRTIARRDGRALVGLSAGGYGATLLGLHHLSAFSVVQSWSGYFHPTTPDGTKPLAGVPDSASAHTLVHTLPAAFRRLPTFLAFYVGDADNRFRAENVRLARELSEAKVPFLFRLYPGDHSRAFWNAHAADWLDLAASHLAPPS